MIIIGLIQCNEIMNVISVISAVSCVCTSVARMFARGELLAELRAASTEQRALSRWR